MKKLFFFAASLLVAGSMLADVTVDLSSAKKPAHAAEKDASTFNVASSVLTITTNVSTAWGANGAEFEFTNPISGSQVTSIKGEAKGTAMDQTWISFIPYLVDDSGARWFNEDLELNLASSDMSDWTEFDYLPSGTPWDGTPSKTFAQSTFVKFGVYANPAVNISNYVFSVRNLKVAGSCITDLEEVKASEPVKKMMVDGKMMIMRDGKLYNVLGF